MPARLITEVIADISKLESELKRAEARWRKYEETARKAASITLTGGSLGRGGGSGGGSGGGGGGAASAATVQKSELKRAEEELKASLKRQQTDLEFALKTRLAAVQTYEKARLKAVDSAFKEEGELRRRAASNARSGSQEQRQAASAARSTFKEEERGLKGSAAFQKVRDQETQADIQGFKKRQDAHAALRDFELEASKEADRAEKAIIADQIAREKQLEAVRLRTERNVREAEKEAEKERKAERQQRLRDEVALSRASAEARRSEAGDLRGQIRSVVGTGAGAGPPFRPLPTGSRPEDILALRKHLSEANAVGARLSRTLRRIGEEDLKNAAQSARFFGNALKLAAGAAIIGGFAQLVKHGIELNREWERFRFGLGTALALTSKVVDAQGKTVTGARAFKVFAKDGEKLFQTIRDEANKTILTTEELVQVVTSNFALAIRAGVPEKEIVGLSNRIATFAKTIGLQGGTPQLVQEVRAILSGGPLRGAQVAQALGLTEKDLKIAKEKGQTLELINKALEDAKPLSDQFQQSSEVAFTTLASKGQTFLRLSLEDVFKRITGRVLDFNKALSEENIQQFAAKTGETLVKLFKPIEEFITSGRGEQLGETFAKAFQAIGNFANSAVFRDFLNLLNFIVDHHRGIALALAPFALIRGGNVLNTAVQSLGTPGSLLAGTALGARARGGLLGGLANTAAGVGGGAAAGAAGAAGLGGATIAVIATAAVAALAEAGIIAKLIQGYRDIPREEVAQAVARRSTGILVRPSAATGVIEERLGAAAATRQAAENLAGARQAAVLARTRGATVTPDQQFTVFDPKAPNGVVQLSIKQAEERLRIARETEAKLRGFAKEGGDRRVAIVKETEFQILDLERLGTQQRIAQLQGNVQKQAELAAVVEIARAKVGKDAIKNEKDRAALIDAIREDLLRKRADREVKAFFETEQAVAQATRNRRRGRQLDTGQDVDAIRERVRTAEISEAQGRTQINARLKRFRDDDLQDQRETRDKAADLVNDYTRTFLRATREQRQAREQLFDFERQTARQARDLARQRIDAERSVTDAIVQQSRLREDVGLRRGAAAQQQRVEGRLRQSLGGAIARRVSGATGSETERVQVEEALRAVAQRVTGGSSRNAGEVEQEIRAELADRGIDVSRLNLRPLANGLFQEQIQARGRGLQSDDLGRGREAEELGLAGGLDVRDQQELVRLRGRRAVLGGALGASEAEALGLLERRQEGATSGTALAGADRQARDSREAFIRLDEQEADFRRESVKAFRDLTDRVKETTVSLIDDFISLGKRARELAQELPQFAGIINPAGVNAIAGLTPAAAAAAAGPGAVNLTVDLRGGLTEGTITDPIVQHVVGLVLTKLQQDLLRGPTR